jgi:hypothetical protein
MGVNLSDGMLGVEWSDGRLGGMRNAIEAKGIARTTRGRARWNASVGTAEITELLETIGTVGTVGKVGIVEMTAAGQMAGGLMTGEIRETRRETTAGTVTDGMRTADLSLTTVDGAPMNVGQLMGANSTELIAGISLKGARVLVHRDVTESER